MITSAKPDPSLEASAVAVAPSASASASAAADAPPKPPEPPKTWAECVRLERWADAAAMLDKLDDEEQKKPEIKYVRARCALALGDDAKAVTLLTKLEADLPMLADDIARHRAEAQAEAGPFPDAAGYFAKSTKARDLARAADAFLKGGDVESALRMADRAVQVAQKAKSKRDETSARAARARARAKKGQALSAELDLRWLAVHAAATNEGRAAVEELEKAKHPLNDKEKTEAVDGLIDAAAPSAVSEIKKLSGDTVQPAALPAHAMSLFRARAYSDAAKAFDAAIAAKVGNPAEELYYAGRSYARSGDDTAAIDRFTQVTDRFKATVQAERSSYYVARLLLQDGKFDEAAAAYGKYIGTFRRGDHRTDAEYEHAIALVSSSTPRDGRIALGKLEGRFHGEELGRIRELEALGALRSGDKDSAIAIWTDVIKSFPLTFAALASRARLAAMDAPAPPLTGAVVPVPPMPIPVKLPAAPALLTSLGLDADAESYLVKSEHDVARDYGGREGEALCTMYGMLSQAKRRYRIGAGRLSANTLLKAPQSSERWAWDCVYPKPYEGNVRALEDEHGIQRGFLYALMRQESAFDPTAVSPVSAIGLMQLMPGTAKQVATELSLDFDQNRLTSPELNLRFGAFYVKKLLKMFGGSMVLASAGYNAGPKAASHWLEAGKDNDVDLWVARIPYDETRGYVAKVMGNLARYEWLEGGDPAVTPLALALPTDAKATPDAY